MGRVQKREKGATRRGSEVGRRKHGRKFEIRQGTRGVPQATIRLLTGVYVKDGQPEGTKTHPRKIVKRTVAFA